MDAIKFLKERQRMFKMAGGGTTGLHCADVNCRKCAFHIKEDIKKEPFCLEDLQDYEGMEAKLKEWIVKHPKKTYQQDFLEKHPNAPLGHNGAPRVCSYEVGYFTADEKLCIISNCNDCAKCWGREME